MDYIDDDFIEEELSIGANFNELEIKLKKELQNLSFIAKDNKEILEIVKRINNIIEWYC